MAGAGEGFGSVTMWGFSPAMDLQDVMCKCECLSRNKQDVGIGEMLEVVNVLLVGAGDCRHILKTMAQRGRHKNRQIHIYVIENNLELLARHLLLLTLALEPQQRMGLQEKSELYAELYGNTLVRQQTLQYLQEKASLFIEMITDLDYADERMPTIDLSQMKFKERDYLESIFKFWRDPDMRNFNVATIWDNRMRQYLDRRYDTRSGAFDWDLMMKLHDLGAKVICKPEYLRWRESGVAFEAREGVYDRANKSMASGILLKKRDGERVPCRGYWGDMVTGPFLAFGIECEDKSLLKTVNNKPAKSSEDLTFRNLTALFHELATGELYREDGGPSGQEASRIMEIDEEQECDVTKKHGNRESYAPITCEEVCVHFLPLNSMTELPKKEKFRAFFNHAFISASMALTLQPALKQIFAPHATLTLELVKFILDLNKPQVEGFSQRVTAMAAQAGFRPAQEASGADDPCASAVDGCCAKFTFDGADHQ